MAYKRKYETVEERRAAQAEGGRLGHLSAVENGTFRPGRKPKDDGSDPYGNTTLSARRIDAMWMTEIASKMNLSRPLLLRVLIQAFRQRVDVRASDEIERILDAEAETLIKGNIFAEDEEEAEDEL